MKSLLDQLKRRRIELGLKQHDMLLRAGISRQQYQRLESKGNPRLDTLELVAKGLKSELVLVPQEKLSSVMAILESEAPDAKAAEKPSHNEDEAPSGDPWQDLLEDAK